MHGGKAFAESEGNRAEEELKKTLQLNPRHVPALLMIADGHIDGLVVQDPMNMGYLGVKTIVARLKGQPVERRIDTGVRVVSRADMETPEAKALLKPDLDRWLKAK